MDTSIFRSGRRWSGPQNFAHIKSTKRFFKTYDILEFDHFIFQSIEHRSAQIARFGPEYHGVLFTSDIFKLLVKLGRQSATGELSFGVEEIEVIGRCECGERYGSAVVFRYPAGPGEDPLFDLFRRVDRPSSPRRDLGR